MNSYDRIWSLLTETKKNRGKRKAEGAHRNRMLGIGTNAGDARQEVQKFFNQPENKAYGVDLTKNVKDRGEANALLLKHRGCVGSTCDAMKQSRTKQVSGLRGREGTSMGAGRIDKDLVRANIDKRKDAKTRPQNREG